MSRHTDWLGLVQVDGLVISEPVLEERFREGPDAVRRGMHTWFRGKLSHYEVAKQRGDAKGVNAWIDFILQECASLFANCDT